jgi:hypothetical protein
MQPSHIALSLLLNALHIKMSHRCVARLGESDKGRTGLKDERTGQPGPGPLKSVFEERILAAAFVGSGPRGYFLCALAAGCGNFATPLLRRWLQLQCGLESSRLRQLFVLVARVHAVAEGYSESLVMIRRTSLTMPNPLSLPAQLEPCSLAQYAMACTAIWTRYLLLFFGAGFQKGADRGRKLCDSREGTPEAALGKPRPQNGKVWVGRANRLLPDLQIRQPQIFSLALYKQSTSHLPIF